MLAFYLIIIKKKSLTALRINNCKVQKLKIFKTDFQLNNNLKTIFYDAKKNEEPLRFKIMILKRKKIYCLY